ncbi:MAG: ANTAR domain-containing protein [Nevskia sp.]|nr:ANTAR domain-containing protein [Nevskia sp.]
MAAGHTKLRVMLVDDDAERLSMLEQALAAEGHTVAARLDTHADLSAAVERCQPEVIFIDVDAPGRDTLESLGQLNREHPRPIVLFASRSDPETTRRAVHAGVSAYVVDGLHPTRLSSVMEVAIARFELHQALRQELDQARTRLADQRDIEKAKGLLMKRRGLDESAAYNLLRRMAMDRKQRIGDFARVLITAADVL